MYDLSTIIDESCMNQIRIGVIIACSNETCMDISSMYALRTSDFSTC